MASRSQSCAAEGTHPPPVSFEHGTIDVTDATFQTDVIDRSARGAGRRRPVGAVVRPVQDARPDPREGRRRHRRQGRAGEGRTPTRTRPSPRPSRCSRSRPCTRSRTAQWSTASSGAYPEHVVQEFVESLLPDRGARRPSPSCSPQAHEGSLRKRCSTIEPATRTPSSRSANCSSPAATSDEALALLARIPERAHPARRGPPGSAPHHRTTTTRQLTALLDQVKTDDEARQKYVDLLELMGPDRPADGRRTARQLTSRLY